MEPSGMGAIGYPFLRATLHQQHKAALAAAVEAARHPVQSPLEVAL
jgi:hypothetical protein